MTTLLRDYPVVKLSEVRGDELLAGMRRDTLFIQRGRCEFGQFPAVLSLTEALRLAAFVLRYAEENGINVQEAAADVRLLPPDWEPDDEGFPRLRF